MVTNDGFLSSNVHTPDLSPEADPFPYEQQTSEAAAKDDTPAREEAPVAEEAQPDVVAEEEAPEETPEPSKYDDLDEYFQKRFGVGLEDVVTLMQDLGQFRNQTLVEKQEAQLKNEWGQNYDDYMDVVRQKFNKLPPEQQAAYDNVDGAKRLLAEYLMYEAPETSKPNQQFVRPNVRRNAPQSNMGYDYRRSEIQHMAETDPSRYDAEQAKITKAYMAGRVLLD